MQRTLKRELKGLEIVKREAIGAGDCPASDQVDSGCLGWLNESSFVAAERLVEAVRSCCTLVWGLPVSVRVSVKGLGQGDLVVVLEAAIGC